MFKEQTHEMNGGTVYYKASALKTELTYLEETIADIDEALAAPNFNTEDTQEVTRSKEFFEARQEQVRNRLASIAISI